ncbi:MAG: type VI secretion system contractile sheath small subunit [Treponema sp.]|nr:type VI secretion system contractile sheath small subunit [Treponema sp.]
MPLVMGVMADFSRKSAEPPKVEDRKMAADGQS